MYHTCIDVLLSQSQVQRKIQSTNTMDRCGAALGHVDKLHDTNDDVWRTCIIRTNEWRRSVRERLGVVAFVRCGTDMWRGSINIWQAIAQPVKSAHKLQTRHVLQCRIHVCTYWTIIMRTIVLRYDVMWSIYWERESLCLCAFVGSEVRPGTLCVVWGAEKM